MTHRCDNCQRPVLNTDTVCWHCGRKLSPPTPKAEKTEPVDVEEKQEPELEPTPLPLIIFYGILTLVIIFLLLLLMNSLSKSPTITNEGSLASEMVKLNDPAQQFSINVPTSWRWTFQDDNLDPIGFTSLEELDRWKESAILPLGTLIPDSENLLIAGDDSILLVVMQSVRLNRLTTEQVVSSLRQEDFAGITVEDVRQVQNEAGKGAAAFIVQHDTPDLRCRQLWTPTDSTSYLVAACTKSHYDGQYENEFDLILDSFQLSSQ